MPEKQKYQAYAMATQTVAPTRQIVLLYEGVIRFVQQAKTAIIEKRIEDRYHLLIKASEVIGGLQGALDFDKGGEIAKILYNFYASIDARLFSIHRTNDIQTCDDIVNDLKQLRDSWDEIDKEAAAKQGGVLPVAPTEPEQKEAAQDVPIPPSGLTLSA